MEHYKKSILSSLMLSILLLFLLSFTSCLKDDNIVNSEVNNNDIEYYIYDQNGEEIHYAKCKHRIVIYVKYEEKLNEVLNEIKSKNFKGLISIGASSSSNILYAKIDSTRTDIVKNIKTIKNVESVHYMVQSIEIAPSEDEFLVTSNAINLKTKSDIDINEVLKKLELTSLVDKIVDRPFTDEPIYTVYFTTTDLDFYKLSRDLYKTGLCVYASPDFLMQLKHPYPF
ncbi:MAG: hypothetical protein GX372_06310 [Ignavibacteria bacterium]|nr:hypothetical protein [Ignavibacteria bacterium]